MTIYLDRAADIRVACNYSITLNTANTNIDYINENTLLLTHVPAYSLQCGAPDGSISSATYKGCDSCLVKLNTQCSLSITNRFTTPSTAAIQPGIDPAVKYLVNAPVLVEFLPPEKLKLLKGDFQSLRIPNITLPNFRFAHDLLQQAMAEDNKLKLDLKESVGQIKTNDIVVGQLSEHMLLNQQFTSGLAFFTTKTGIDTTVFSVSITILIITTFTLYFKLRKLTFALAILSQMHTTKADTLQFNYFAASNEQTINDTVAEDILKTFVITHSHTVALFTLAIILAIAVLAFSLRTLYKNLCTHYVKDPIIRIWLQILSGDSPVSVHVLTLHGLHHEYTALADQNINAIALRLTCTGPQLQISWPTLRLRDQITNAEFFLRTSYHVGPLTALALRRKLCRPFIVLLLATTRDQTHRVDVHTPATAQAQQMHVVYPTTTPTHII